MCDLLQTITKTNLYIRNFDLISIIVQANFNSCKVSLKISSFGVKLAPNSAQYT